MSNTQFIFIDKNHIPTKTQLQNSIDKLGYNFLLDPEFTPFEDEGFSPCTLNKESNVGFEIFYEPACDVINDDIQLKSIANGKNYCINLNWGGNMKDFACVMIVSSALAKYHQAIISYEGEGAESTNKLIKDTKAIVKNTTKSSNNATPQKTFDKKEIEKLLLTELDSTTGETLKVSTSYNWGSQITAITSNAYHFRTQVFKITTNNNSIDVTNYGEAISKLTAKLFSLGENPSSLEIEELEKLSNDKDDALDRDEKSIIQIQTMLKSLTNIQVIKKVKWNGSNRLNLYCSNFIIHLISLDDHSLGNIVFTTPKYQFEISQSNISLREL